MNAQPNEVATKPSAVAAQINPVERQNIVLRVREYIDAVQRQYWVLQPCAVVNMTACEFLPPRVAIALSWNNDETMKLWSEALAQCKVQ